MITLDDVTAEREEIQIRDITDWKVSKLEFWADCDWDIEISTVAGRIYGTFRRKGVLE